MMIPCDLAKLELSEYLELLHRDMTAVLNERVTESSHCCLDDYDSFSLNIFYYESTLSISASLEIDGVCTELIHKKALSYSLFEIPSDKFRHCTCTSKYILRDPTQLHFHLHDASFP